MRRLIWLSICAAALLIGTAGCAKTTPAGTPKSESDGAPASQDTQAPAGENPSLGTPIQMRNAGSALEDRTGKDKPAGANAREADFSKGGPPPNISEVQKYLSRLVYPGSDFMNAKGPTSNGQVAIAMTQANAEAGKVRDHFVRRGAKVIDQRSENGGTAITLELVDDRAGVSTAIAITQTSLSDAGCLVNYSAHGIATQSDPGSTSIPDVPAGGTSPGGGIGTR